MENTDVSFVIVSYNTADLIATCIRSVQAVGDCSTEVIVVDNASSDRSADLIRTEFPGVILIVNEKNRGFAAANNQVISLCRGRYVFFLNPDAWLEPSSLRGIISFMDENPAIGLAGARILNPDGSVQESLSYRYPGHRHARHELKNLKGRIACVLGAGMIARTDLIRKLGGFDEDFFLYGEDQDLCLRLRKGGYEIGYCDRLTVAHLAGQSERQSDLSEILRKKASAEYLFYLKHYRPQTVAKIARKNLIQAKWRIMTITLTLPFSADKAKDRRKLLKYQIAHERAKKLLSELNRRAAVKRADPVSSLSALDNRPPMQTS